MKAQDEIDWLGSGSQVRGQQHLELASDRLSSMTSLRFTLASQRPEALL